MKRKQRAVAILDVMWDDREPMSNPNYLATAPRAFHINPQNTSGKRLYSWLGKHYKLLVTNACPQVVASAKGRGSPDVIWLRENLEQLWPFQLLLVCGNVAHQAFDDCQYIPPINDPLPRMIYMPHPAARRWTTAAMQRTTNLVQNGIMPLTLKFHAGTIKATSLTPF